MTGASRLLYMSVPIDAIARLVNSALCVALKLLSGMSKD